MEKVPGVQLNKVWLNMDIKDRFEIAFTISGYQKALMLTSFAQYGSLYYLSDLDDPDGFVLVKENGTRIKEHHFTVGPSAGQGFLDDGRIALDLD